jgi:response regulator RpfG family c-di-GMP phosphodiesterase
MSTELAHSRPVDRGRLARFTPQARIAPAANQAEPANLLVNDDPGAPFALRGVLGDLDADLVTASSGEHALLRLLKQDFCVILMDVKMSGRDGF